MQNPYEPPQSPPSDEVRPRQVFALSVLMLLSIPAAAIAGTATCTGAAQLMKSLGDVDYALVLAAFLGGASTFVIVTAAVVWQERRRHPFGQNRMRDIVEEVVMGAVLGGPLAIGTLLFSSCVGYIHLHESSGVADVLMFVPGLLANLVLAIACVDSWRRSKSKQ